jgi:prefoldin subunit 5
MEKKLKIRVLAFDKAIHDITKEVKKLEETKETINKALIQLALCMGTIREELIKSIDTEED